MKKIFKTLLIVTLFVFTIGILNVKAEESELVNDKETQFEVSSNDNAEVIGSEFIEKEEGETEESNGLNPEVEALAHNNNTDKHQNCYFFINTYNNQRIGMACTPEGTSSNKTFKGQSYLKPFSSQGVEYEFAGWYDEEDNLLETSTTIKVKVNAPTDSCEVHYIYAKWNEYKAPVLYFNYYDEVSTGSGSWGNENGVSSSYKHTFKAPESKDHYSFLYWKVEDTTYVDGDVYTYDLFSLNYNDEVTVEGYAWWKADVTLNLYDGTSLLGSESKFDSITINNVIESNPTKEGYVFLGWVDGEGNDITDSTFYAEDPSTNPIPKTVNLYAKWGINIVVTKTWDDSDNNDNIRPDSVTVNLINKDTEEVLGSATLSEEENNGWSYTFVVSADSGINYWITENEVEGYTSEVTGSVKEGFIIKNTHDLIKTPVTITKEWDDEDDEDEIRPDSVTVYIYKNNGSEKVQDVEVKESDGWTTTVYLQAYINGEAIDYTVIEGEVEYYESTVTGSVKEGFVVKNYHEVGGKGDGEDPEEPTPIEPVNEDISDNPKTGDNIIMNIMILLISAFGLTGTLYLRKYNFCK